MAHKDARVVGLPVRDFLYTIDQIASLLEVQEAHVYNALLFYQNRSVGVRPKDRMIAHDISAPTATKPEWRVTEREFVRWLKYKGYRYQTRGYVS